MTALNEKQTIPSSSVGADEEQSVVKHTNIITKNDTDSKQQNMENSVQNAPMKVGAGELQTVTLTEILDTTYAPKIPVVEGVLNNGTYLFVGAPKVGKSFFMAQLGYHVSKGIPLWGKEVNQGTVLYLALEDDCARIQQRLVRMFGEEDNDDFFFAIQSDKVNAGLEEQLNHFIEKHIELRLIIIDTLQKVRQVSNVKGGYSDDYDIIAEIKKISDKHNICILIVHHTRKMGASDSFERISGSNALFGAADGAFIVDKEKRTDNVAVMEVVGRDQQNQKLHLEFDCEKCVWNLTEIENELWKPQKEPLLEQLASLVSEENPIWKGTATELIEVLGIEMQSNALTRKLNSRVGELLREYHIDYDRGKEKGARYVEIKYVNH